MAKYEQCDGDGHGECGAVHWKLDPEPPEGEEAEYYAACTPDKDKPCKGKCGCYLVITANGTEKDKTGKKKVSKIYKDDEVYAFAPFTKKGERADMLPKRTWNTYETGWKKDGVTLTLGCACLTKSN